jgi:hypothetical protein
LNTVLEAFAPRLMLSGTTGALLDAGQSCRLNSSSRSDGWFQKACKTAADAARLFKIHSATVSQLLTREPGSRIAYAK